MKQRQKPKKSNKKTTRESSSTTNAVPESIRSDNQSLELQSSIALRGANDFRDRLLIAMATGTPSISELAYAVKVRVKEDYKITEKVLRKRAPSDPEYGVSRLRDIVGVRIVTLYRLDALRIIPLVLHKIIAESDGPSGLFVPNSIEELMIFTNNPDGDAQALPGRIMDIFGAFDLKAKAKVVSAATNYTSIHMVAWGRGKYAESYKDIPVEIQIRTALEDVWGEIDHALKYKRKNLTNPNMPGKRRLDSVLSHLNVMKTLIDGTAQYADQIKIQLDELDQDNLTSASTRQAEDAIELLAPLSDLPPALTDAVTQAVKHEREAFRQLSASSKEDELLALSNLHSARGRLEEALGILKGPISLSDNSQKVAAYVVEMEKALVLYELGKKVESGANLLAEAATIYRRYEQEYPTKALVKYRHATVLDALGDRASAKGKFQQTLDLIAQDRSELPKGHWIRSATPRYLGTMLWEEAYDIERRSLGTDQKAIREQRHKLYLAAYRVTLSAYNIELDTNIPHGAQPASMERQRVVNNLLYYVLDYLESEGDIKTLQAEGYKDGDIQKLIHEGGGSNLQKITDVDYLDTLRRAYEHLKNHAIAVKIAKRIVHTMNGYRRHGLVMSKHQADILQDAEGTIAIRDRRRRRRGASSREVP